MTMRALLPPLLALSALVNVSGLSAQAPIADATTGAATPLATAPSARTYSLPWNLRPAAVLNVVRVDSSLGVHRMGDNVRTSVSGTHLVLAGVRLEPWLMAMARLGVSWSADPQVVALSNVLLGANAIARPDERWRLGVFLGVGLPTGTAGAGAQAQADARLTRLAMDSLMYMPDAAAGALGLSATLVDAGWTLQAEGTLLALPPVRGAADTIVNTTFGVHVGYTPHELITLSIELHHQHFLTTTAAMVTDPDLRSQTSGTAGVRLHVPLGGSVVAHPGLAYARGFDAPMAGSDFHVIQLDLPVAY